MSEKFVVCSYTAKPGKEAELEKLLHTHWPTMHRLGLASDLPARILKGQPAKDHGAGGKYLELFQWKDENSMGLAHQSPDVMAIWEPIGACCSEMDFPGFVDITQ